MYEIIVIVKSILKLIKVIIFLWSTDKPVRPANISTDIENDHDLGTISTFESTLLARGIQITTIDGNIGLSLFH